MIGRRRRNRGNREWTIEMDSHGRATVLRGGRQLKNDLDADAAMNYILKHIKPGDRIFGRAPDGYRREIHRKARTV